MLCSPIRIEAESEQNPPELGRSSIQVRYMLQKDNAASSLMAHRSPTKGRQVWTQ